MTFVPRLSAAPFFMPTHSFTASEIESEFAAGRVTVGAGTRYDSVYLEGTSYTRNYSYPLTRSGRTIGVLHIHYNTNNASDVKSTATIGLSKIKQSDRGSTLSFNPSPGLIAAARNTH